MSNITYPPPSATTCPLYGGASARKGGGHVIQCGGWESPFSSDKEYQARIEKCKGPEKESCRFFLLDWMRKNGHEDEVMGLSDEAIRNIYDGYRLKEAQRAEITPAVPAEVAELPPVELREAPPPGRTIADVTAEIRFYKAQTVQSVIEIGKRLTEAKGMLEHGQWLDWLENQVGLHKRTAQNFMQLAEQFPKAQPVAHLSYTKLLALLAVPEEEREEFLEVPHNVGGEEKTVAEMSKRELEKVIRERDQARREQERFRMLAEASEKTAEIRQKKLEEKGQELYEVKNQAAAEKLRYERELKRLESRPVEVAVQPPGEEEIERIREEARAEALAEAETGQSCRHNLWLENLVEDRSESYFWDAVKSAVYVLMAVAAKKPGRQARETLEQGITFLHTQIDELRRQCNMVMIYEPPGELEEDFDFSPED